MQGNQQCWRIIATRIQICKQMSFCSRIKIDPALLISFTMHDTFACFKIDIATVELHKLPHTDTCRSKQINHRKIAKLRTAITKRLERFIRIHWLQNPRCSDLLNSSNGALVDIVFLFEPREKARNHTPNVINGCLSSTTVPRITRKVIADVFSRHLVGSFRNALRKTRKRTPVVAQ